MIIIAEELLAKIYAHARRAYPHECCGILTGEGGCGRVKAVYPVRNLNRRRAHDRYELDPGQFQRIDDEARAAGLSVLGFYHSHPDHPAEPSEFDTRRAWEGYSYLIVAVAGGEKVQASCWKLNGQGRFEQERINSKSGDDA